MGKLSRAAAFEAHTDKSYMKARPLRTKIHGKWVTCWAKLTPGGKRTSSITSEHQSL